MLQRCVYAVIERSCRPPRACMNVTSGTRASLANDKQIAINMLKDEVKELKGTVCRVHRVLFSALNEVLAYAPSESSSAEWAKRMLKVYGGML